MKADARQRQWLIWLCQGLIVLGLTGRLYGLNDPWKRHDHYNFGGVWTTSYAECLKTTPLAVSKGVPHTRCWTNEPVYYRAHPPTILFAMWGWTSLFGSSEAAYRLFTFMFSALNVLMMFRIARLARPDSAFFAWMTAAFQSVFLGNIYFGTHLDFISEFTVFFTLVMTELALRRQMTAASFAALTAGISAWPGYISFAPLWLYAWMIGRGRKRVFAMGALGFALALLTMMWLQQKLDIIDFFKMKLFDPGYIKAREKGVAEPFLFAMNAVTSWARLLSPVFAALAVFEIIRRDTGLLFSSWRSRWQGLSAYHHAVWLSGGTGLFYALLGHEYFMVHVFLYLLLTPAFALTAARLVERSLEEPQGLMLSKPDQRWLTGLTLAFAALYPYGIFKTSVVHDAANSLIFILSALTLIGILWRSRLTARAIAGFVIAGAVGNLSQVMNYRNEPDTERSFCLQARDEHARTGATVITSEPYSDAKEILYCRGIPIEYRGDAPK